MKENYYIIMVEKYTKTERNNEPVEVYCAVLTDDKQSIKLFRKIDVDKPFPNNDETTFEAVTKKQGTDILSVFTPEDEVTRNSIRQFLLLEEDKIDFNYLMGVRTETVVE